MEILKKKILEKKELSGLPHDFLDKFLVEYKLKYPKKFSILEEKNYNEKSKEFEEIKKAIRKKIRGVHGVFAKTPLSEQKRKKIISCLKNADSKKKQEIINKILESHQSTFERKNSYNALYSKILENYSNKNNLKKILDLGCGYNPFSYQYLSLAPEYFAVDINKEDAEFIQEFFSLTKIKGKCVTLDLTEDKNMKIIDAESKNSDICLALKLLDSLESKKRGASKTLLMNINSDLIVVSFALKTISGKNNIEGKRTWFWKIIEEGNYFVEEFDLENEKYYLLKRANSLIK